MSPFQILGLRHDADEPAIKRTYARLLKQHRPDEDPVGFQRINEAFQACVAHARYAVAASADLIEFDPKEIIIEPSGVDDENRAVGTGSTCVERPAAIDAMAANDEAEDSEIIGQGSPRTSSDAEASPRDATAVRETISFDLGVFVDALLQHDRAGSAVVRTWLVGHEALYSLELKDALVAPLLQNLLQHETRMSIDGLAAMLDFFHLDTVHNGHPWLTDAVEALRFNTFVAAHFDALVAAHTKGAKSPPRGPGFQATPVDRLMLRELLGPSAWLRRIFLALVPFLPTRVIQMLARLREFDAEYANTRIDLDAAAWWEKITDQRRIGSLRAVLALARIVPLALLLAWSTGNANNLTNLWQGFVSSLIWLGGLWLSYALATMARIRAADWQLRHPRVHLRSLSCIAMVAAATLVGIGIDPVLSIYFFIGATWLLTVNPPMQGRLPALAALVTGTGSYFALAGWMGLALSRPGPSFVAALALSFVVVLANDYLFAKENDLSLEQARKETGWLKRVIIANIASAIVLVGAISTP